MVGCVSQGAQMFVAVLSGTRCAVWWHSAARCRATLSRAHMVVCITAEPWVPLVVPYFARLERLSLQSEINADQ